jgi:hypothetical protein
VKEDRTDDELTVSLDNYLTNGAEPSLFVSYYTSRSLHINSKVAHKKTMTAKKCPPTPVEINEKDVLMGRGKRVSEWPGNIYFRQAVNRFRDQYTKAARHEKVQIADKVIEMMHAVSGRFLKENSDGTWSEVEKDRAVEKTCQALREKEKARTPSGDPFANPDKKVVLTQRSKRRRDESDDDSDLLDSDADSADGSDSDSDVMLSSLVLKKQQQQHPDPKINPMPIVVQPLDQLKALDDDDMVRKLSQFRRQYGHCGVPPGWPHDTSLADWCSAKRLVRREIDVGHREVTEQEKDLQAQLDDLDFCYDYNSWHWHDRFDKLRACQNGIKSEDVDVMRMELYTPKNIVKWLEQQRFDLRTNNWNSSYERLRKLNEVGIVL